MPKTTSPRSARVATDVGGTFTDLVYFTTDAAGRQVVRTAKADTTPPDFERGIMHVLEKAGIDLATRGFLAHGTTAVINALTECKGVRTALITSAGFTDVLRSAAATGRVSSTCNTPSPPASCPLRYALAARGG